MFKRSAIRRNRRNKLKILDTCIYKMNKTILLLFVITMPFIPSYASHHYQWSGYPYCEYLNTDGSEYGVWKEYPYCKYYLPIEGHYTSLKPHKEKVAIRAKIKPIAPTKIVRVPVSIESVKIAPVSYQGSLKLQISASSWMSGAKNLDILLGVNQKLEFGLALYEKNDRFKYGIKTNYFITGETYKSGWYVMGSFFYQPENVDYERHNHPIIDEGYYEGNLAVYYQWQLPIFNHIFTSVGAGYHFRDKISPYFNWNMGVWL